MVSDNFGNPNYRGTQTRLRNLQQDIMQYQFLLENILFQPILSYDTSLSMIKKYLDEQNETVSNL